MIFWIILKNWCEEQHYANKEFIYVFGTQELFRDVNLFIDDYEKVGIVGVNGSGKPTFFKIIMGILKPDKGNVIFTKNIRVEWLPQIIGEELYERDITALDFLLLGRPLAKLEKELQLVYAKIANEKDEHIQRKMLKNIADLQNELEYWEVYKAEGKLLKIISGMNIPDSLLDQKLTSLSGGQKSKVAFARLLYSKPEVVLLDEPTNHLDKESRDYVINFLRKYNGSVFVISHDADFLNQVTSKILFIDKRIHDMKLYNGNYDTFRRLKEETEKSIKSQAKIQKLEESRLKDFINKYSSTSGKRKRMVQDREKKLEKLLENKIEVISHQKTINLNMKVNRESATIPLKIKNLSFRYDKLSKQKTLSNLSFEIYKGERFLVVGPNGSGKSTLLKLIIGELKADEGIIQLADKTDIGYYAQEHELLDNNKNILENFLDINISQKQLRGILGRFLFYGDDVFKKIDVLSPGERSRVALAKLSLKEANLLVLDEPTNHLDPETQDIIAEIFNKFSGTMLVVSHNPAFVDNLGIERTLMLPSGEISYYDKNTVEYYQTLNTTDKDV